MLRTYTRLRPERREPRRNEGRVEQERIKPRLTEPSPEQEHYHDRLRYFPDGKRRPCQCGCGRLGEHVHHIKCNMPGKMRKRDHWCVVLLAPFCHVLGRDSIHGLGSETAFKEVHGVDLIAIAADNLRQWEADNAS